MSTTVTSNVSSSEDSDATVAPDMEGNLKMLEGTSQASQPCSPSFLKPKIKSASINPNFSKISSTGHSQDVDMVPCSSDSSSDEVDEDEVVMSQEYLPESMYSETQGNNTSTAERGHNLSQIAVEQKGFNSELDRVDPNYMRTLPSSFVKGARKKLSRLQNGLKEVSKSHQIERKQLASAYTRLSQDPNLTGKEKEPFKAQMVSLSARHKELLHLFSIQKEIGVKLAKLEEQVATSKHLGSTTRNKVSSCMIPSLEKHLQPQPQPRLQDNTCVYTPQTRCLPVSTTTCPVPISADSTVASSCTGQPVQGPCQMQILENSFLEDLQKSMSASLHLNSRAVASVADPAIQARPESLQTSSQMKNGHQLGNSRALNASGQQSSALAQKTRQPLQSATAAAQPEIRTLLTNGAPGGNLLQSRLKESSRVRTGTADGTKDACARAHQVTSIQSSQSQEWLASQPTVVEESAMTLSQLMQGTSLNERQPDQNGSQEKQLQSSIPLVAAAATGSSDRQTEDSEGGKGSLITSVQAESQAENQVDVTKTRPLSSAELNQPVPLEVLIKHKILEARPQSLTCTILGCDFIGSLLEDGSIQEVPVSSHVTTSGQSQTSFACLHRQPQLWIKACWTQLGHSNKMINKKQAYRSIVYMGKTLMQYCEQYSLQQVSSFHSQQQSALMTNSQPKVTDQEQPSHADIEMEVCDFSQQLEVSPTQPSKTVAESIDAMLLKAQVLLIPDNSPSLDLPQEFWDEEDIAKFMPLITHQIEHSFDW